MSADGLAVVIDELVVPGNVDREALAAAVAAELDRLGPPLVPAATAPADVRLHLAHRDLVVTGDVAGLAAVIARAIITGLAGGTR